MDHPSIVRRQGMVVHRDEMLAKIDRLRLGLPVPGWDPIVSDQIKTFDRLLAYRNLIATTICDVLNDLEGIREFDFVQVIARPPPSPPAAAAGGVLLP